MHALRASPDHAASCVCLWERAAASWSRRPCETLVTTGSTPDRIGKLLWGVLVPATHGIIATHRQTITATHCYSVQLPHYTSHAPPNYNSHTSPNRNFHIPPDCNSHTPPNCIYNTPPNCIYHTPTQDMPDTRSPNYLGNKVSDRDIISVLRSIM